MSKLLMQDAPIPQEGEVIVKWDGWYLGTLTELGEGRLSGQLTYHGSTWDSDCFTEFGVWQHIAEHSITQWCERLDAEARGRAAA